ITSTAGSATSLRSRGQLKPARRSPRDTGRGICKSSSRVIQASHDLELFNKVCLWLDSPIFHKLGQPEFQLREGIRVGKIGIGVDDGMRAMLPSAGIRLDINHVGNNGVLAALVLDRTRFPYFASYQTYHRIIGTQAGWITVRRLVAEMLAKDGRLLVPVGKGFGRNTQNALLIQEEALFSEPDTAIERLLIADAIFTHFGIIGHGLRLQQPRPERKALFRSLCLSICHFCKDAWPPGFDIPGVFRPNVDD